MAEKVGFEPTDLLRSHRFSSSVNHALGIFDDPPLLSINIGLWTLDVLLIMKNNI